VLFPKQVCQWFRNEPATCAVAIARPVGGRLYACRDRDGRGEPMPAERVSMRRIREILCLKYEGGATERAIARAIGVGRRPGVTRMLLRAEYRQAEPDGYGYSRWRELYPA